MAEDYDIDEILEEIEQDGDSAVEEAAADAEEKFEREDKVSKKIRKSFEELDAKMDAMELSRIIERFEEGADDTEKFLFDVVRGDLRDPKTATDAIKKVQERAAELKKKQEEREAEIAKAAEEQAAQVWGTGPMGRSAPTDLEKEQMERIAAGDISALAEACIGGDLPF